MLGSNGCKDLLQKGIDPVGHPLLTKCQYNMEKLIQITSGRGPLECQWVVAKVLKTFLEATQNNIEYEIIHRESGDENLTLKSVTLLLKGKK
jgi:hypothetical protein